MDGALEEARELGRYAQTPWQITWKGWKKIFWRSVSRFSEADISLRCAGVAFFTFFSIFPALAAGVLTYGLLLDRNTLRDHLASIQPLLPADAYNLIAERLESLLSQPETGLGIGLLFSLAIALWSGSRGVGSLVGLVSQTYRERDERNFLVSAALSLGLTFGGIICFAIAVFTVAALPALFLALPFGSVFETTVLWLRWPLLAAFVVLGLTVLYRLAPDRDAPSFVWLLPGALFAGLMWIGVSFGFSIYVEQFGNYSATFGSLSIAVVTMLWIYYSVTVFALGGVLNAEAELQTRVDTTTGSPKPLGQRGAVVADNLPEKLSE